MALVLKDRVQETATPNTTVSFSCNGALTGFQAFSVIGNGNTTYYTGVDGSGNWECGLGTYTTAGNLVTRTTISASSNAGSAVTFSGAVSLFVNYPATKSVNLDASGNVSPLGTVTSGTWQGSTVGVAYGGTGVTTSTGANSVVLRDTNENIIVNSVTQELTSTVSSATITTLTAASSHFQVLTGTTTQTYKLPDATSLPTGSTWVFDNDSTGNLAITDNAGATVDVVAAGGYATVFLEANGTVGGEWGRFGMVPSEVNWGTNSLNLGGSTLITNGTWNGTTIAYNYGGTGLTSFAAANNALYSTSASALTAGTLPVLAGGTGVTTSTGTGSTVLSATPTFTGTLNAANLAYTGTLTGGTGVIAIGSDQIYKDASGNVGIGTSSPSKILHVYTTNGNGIYVEDSSSANPSPTIRVRGWRTDTNGSQTFGGGLVLERKGDSAAANGNVLGTIYFGGNYNTTPNFGYAASISGIADGAFTSSTNTPTALTFYTGVTPNLDTNNANVFTGTERMRIDSAGNVGIGIATSIPSQLAVSGTGQLVSAITDAGVGTGTIQIHSTSAAAGAGGALLFSALTSVGSTTPQWAIKSLLTSSITNGIGDLVFSGRTAIADTALTERMRIDNAGNVTLQGNISVGAAAPTTSGSGITFPATQAASSNANTLDDYEEGTWTPVLTSGFTTTGTVTRAGYYTKVGRVVTVNFLITATSVSPANGAVMSGLPFTATQYGIGLSTNNGGTTTAMSITVSGSTLIFGGVSISAANIIGSITYIAS